jgi:hypothetical protein
MGREGLAAHRETGSPPPATPAPAILRRARSVRDELRVADGYLRLFAGGTECRGQRAGTGFYLRLRPRTQS